MKMHKFTRKRSRPFMTGTSKEEPSKSMKRFGYIILALSFFHVSCAHIGWSLRGRGIVRERISTYF